MGTRTRITLALLLLLAVLMELRIASTFVSSWEKVLLLNFRLPRLVLALMLGSGMALSGWAAQRSTRNSLASPDLLTVPAAALLGVMLVLFLSGGRMLSSHTLPLVAAGAGTLSASLLFSVVGRRRQLDGSGLLLIGIAFGSLLTAASLLLALNSPSSVYQYAIAFFAGSLGRASWDYIWMLLPVWWVLVAALVLVKQRIDVLALEDQIVTSLGGHAMRWRRLGLCLSAALGAACIGVGGNLAFVGFVAPHIVSRASGRILISPFLVGVIGALLLLVSDVIGQTILRPGEIPAGIITAVVGAPLFVLVLMRRRVIQ